MKFSILLVWMVLVVSCAPLSDATADPGSWPPDTAVTNPLEDITETKQPQPSPFFPKPGDEKLTQGIISIEEVSLVIRESYPPQVSLSIRGDLPTPCHELRAKIATPDPGNKIIVDAYSVVDPHVACIQVLEPFQEYIDLGIFPRGHFLVWVNGQLAGEFDS